MPVTSVTEGQELNAAQQLEDVYEVTFTFTDRPGSFSFTVPQTGDPVAAAAAKIAEIEGQVGGIYGIGT